MLTFLIDTLRIPPKLLLLDRQHPVRRGQDKTLLRSNQSTRYPRNNRSTRPATRMPSRGQSDSRQKANPLSSRNP